MKSVIERKAVPRSHLNGKIKTKRSARGEFNSVPWAVTLVGTLQIFFRGCFRTFLEAKCRFWRRWELDLNLSFASDRCVAIQNFLSFGGLKWDPG